MTSARPGRRALSELSAIRAGVGGGGPAVDGGLRGLPQLVQHVGQGAVEDGVAGGEAEGPLEGGAGLAGAAHPHQGTPQRRVHNTVLIPIGGIQRAVVEALRYGESLSDDVRGIYVDVDPVGTERVKRDWETWGGGVKLVVLSSPYRSLMEPLLEYIEQVEAERPDDYVTVILPEFVPARWWQHLLHNQRALLIKGALLFRPNTVVTSVPFHLAR